MSKEILEQCFWQAVRRVDPYAMIRNQVRFNGEFLEISNAQHPVSIELKNIDRILICGAGKASAPMARAFEEVLEEYAGPLEGIVSVKYGHLDNTSVIRLKEAGHPVPDENSIAAAREISALLEGANERTLVLNLISGGGSSLLAKPYPGLAYDAFQEMTRVLLECGADIHELNTLRKHASGIKGGRLAELAYPARLVNIILSDVLGDDLEVIASGPGVPDPSTFAEVWDIIRTYDIEKRIPDAIIRHFRRGLKDSSLETPKPNAPVFDRVSSVVLGNNRSALQAAADWAKGKGLKPFILGSRINGEAREVAKVFAAMALEPMEKGTLLLAGGETTVTIRGKGLGGRNQELALSYASNVLRSGQMPKADFLSAGSDGNDGPTDAAGAIICREDLSKLASAPKPEPWLAQNDSYHYLSEQELLFKTGPTNTNVCDFCFLLFD